MAETPGTDQAEYWRSARQWVEEQEVLDTLMQPVLDRLLAEARLTPGARVLDVGCGTGASTIATAQLVGMAGHVTGVDISGIMLEQARRRTREAGLENVRYLEGDAQTCALGDATHDIVMSRFGVMFFGDPVAAFDNIRKALKPGGTMVFLAWAGLSGNPWFAVPRQAAIDVLGPPAPADPRAPGPMAFQEQDYVAGILRDAGWEGIEITEVAIDLTPPGSVADVATFATRLGPASRIIADLGGSEADTQKVEAFVAARMADFASGEVLHVPARLNLVRAKRSAQ